MKNIIKSVSVIVGAVVGAGFASGQEIYSFFNVYNENGAIGIIISSILLGTIIYKVLKISNNCNATTYSELLEKINIPPKVKNILNIIINIFLLISFYIMIAGVTAYFKQEFDVPSIITAFIITGICYITFMKNIEGITKVSMKIVPILIIIIIIMSSFKINSGSIFASPFSTNGCTMSINITANIPQNIEFSKHTFPFKLNILFE